MADAPVKLTAADDFRDLTPHLTRAPGGHSPPDADAPKYRNGQVRETLSDPSKFYPPLKTRFGS